MFSTLRASHKLGGWWQRTMWGFQGEALSFPCGGKSSSLGLRKKKKVGAPGHEGIALKFWQSYGQLVARWTEKGGKRQYSNRKNLLGFSLFLTSSMFLESHFHTGCRAKKKKPQNPCFNDLGKHVKLVQTNKSFLKWTNNLMWYAYITNKLYKFGPFFFFEGAWSLWNYNQPEGVAEPP